jgi:hypothetical protein
VTRRYLLEEPWYQMRGKERKTMVPGRRRGEGRVRERKMERCDPEV